MNQQNPPQTEEEKDQWAKDKAENMLLELCDSLTKDIRDRSVAAMFQNESSVRAFCQALISADDKFAEDNDDDPTEILVHAATQLAYLFYKSQLPA